MSTWTDGRARSCTLSSAVPKARSASGWCGQERLLAKRAYATGHCRSGGVLAAVLYKNARRPGVACLGGDVNTIKAANLFAAGKLLILAKVAALAEGLLQSDCS